MTDHKGDSSKQPDTCRVNVSNQCQNLQSHETWSSETRWCDVCGERFTLYDDVMR